MQRLLSTTEFANAIGISKSSVRRLADNGQVAIQKTQGGHRKIPVEEAIRYVRENNLQPQDPGLLGIAISNSAADPNTFSTALVEGDGDAAVRVVQTLYLQGKNLWEIFDGPVINAMQRISGSSVEDKRIVFVEHRATVICMRALMQLRPLLPRVREDAGIAICAAPAGDPYLIPSLMCSLVLCEAGFRDINLGPNTPLDILVDAIEDESPSIISLSITSTIRSRSQVMEISKLNNVASKSGCQLVIGGQNADLVDLPNVRRGYSMYDLKSLAEHS